MPIFLFMIIGFMDLYWFVRQDLLSTLATVDGAQVAALGQADDEVAAHTVVASQNVLKGKDVTVTPCSLRKAGTTATVASDLYLTPLTALYAPFWTATGRTTRPIHYSTSLGVVVPCGSPP